MSEDGSFRCKQMRRALQLARRGAGRVSPNPLVGAVIVKEGKRVGEGFHLYERRDHAEVLALSQAGDSAIGADLYVNLEPCAHYGRTPPCVERILESGIRNVYLATLDPNPQVSGKGVEVLRKEGVHVEVGLCEKEALRLNEAFFHYITAARPFVTLKLAMTLDGKIAAESGESKWITGEKARREGHRLRFESDAIMVGINTVLRDDPSLDVRWRNANRITKVVLDTHLKTPPDAQLFDSGDPVVIFHGPEAVARRQRFLRRKPKLVSVPVSAAGLEMGNVLDELGGLSISSLLIEGGSRVAASAVRGGYVNKVALFYGPKLIGGSGLSSFGDMGVESLERCSLVADISVHKLGEDFLVVGYLG